MLLYYDHKFWRHYMWKVPCQDCGIHGYIATGKLYSSTKLTQALDFKSSTLLEGSISDLGSMPAIIVSNSVWAQFEN